CRYFHALPGRLNGYKTRMLKQIPVTKLRPGMYIHRINAPWLKHPFWKQRFLVESYIDLLAMRANNIETVWINTRRGLDVLPDQAEHNQDFFWADAATTKVEPQEL